MSNLRQILTDHLDSELLLLEQEREAIHELVERYGAGIAWLAYGPFRDLLDSARAIEGEERLEGFDYPPEWIERQRKLLLDWKRLETRRDEYIKVVREMREALPEMEES